MKPRKHSGITLLALSLATASCAMVPGSLAPKTGLQNPLGDVSDNLTVQNHSAILKLSIRWPQSTQMIPANTTQVVVDVMKENAVIGTKTIIKGTNALGTAVFSLDPTLENVVVAVTAKDINGNVLATGLQTVALRDNTVSNVSIILTNSGLALDDTMAYAILMNPRSLKDRFVNWDVDDQSTGSIANLRNAVNNVTQQFPSHPAMFDDPTFCNVAMGSGSIQTLKWRGYRADFTTDFSTNNHSVEANIVPDNTLASVVDSSTAKVRFEVTANQWVGGDTGVGYTTNLVRNAYDPGVFFGPQQPATNSVTAVKGNLELIPDGLSAQKATASIMASNFGEVGSNNLLKYYVEGPLSNLVRMLRINPDEMHYLPRTITVGLNSVPLTLDAQFEAATDYHSGTITGQFAALDNKGGKHPITFLISLNDTGDVTFEGLDELSKLKVEGSLKLGISPPEIHAQFTNHESQKVLATLDFLPSFMNGVVDFSKLANWPTLKLNDGNDTQIPMTPGYFSGNANADGQIEIGVY
jgi:hypothetical protein